MLRAICWAFLVVLAACLIQVAVTSCASNPVVSESVPMPRSSDEGKAQLEKWYRDHGQQVPEPFCWWWFGVDGTTYTRCEWNFSLHGAD